MPLGASTPSTPEEDWQNGLITVDVGKMVKFKHSAVKMQRTEDGTKLIGKLRIC